MTVYMSQTAGIYGGLISKKQADVQQVAAQLGSLPMSFYYYDDSQEPADQLSARLDGVMAGFSYGDDLILQLPSFMSLRYLNTLVDKLAPFRQNSATRLLMFLHDDLLFDGALKKNSPLVALLNRADILIVNSPVTAAFLAKQGVHDVVFRFFHICDYLAPCYQLPMSFNEHLNLLNGGSDIIQDLGAAQAQLTVYGASSQPAHRTSRLGLLDEDLTYYLMKNGGWGLLWPQLEREAVCSSYQLGVFLSATIPVIAKAGTVEADLVDRYHCGVVISSLAEAVEKVQGIGLADYSEYQHNAARLGNLTRSGEFTRNVLIEALDVRRQS